jgi:hypothetical protein
MPARRSAIIAPGYLRHEASQQRRQGGEHRDERDDLNPTGERHLGGCSVNFRRLALDPSCRALGGSLVYRERFGLHPE